METAAELLQALVDVQRDLEQSKQDLEQARAEILAECLTMLEAASGETSPVDWTWGTGTADSTPFGSAEAPSGGRR